MKKKILSLVAFMAFSVSAFANTVESKEEVVVSVETEKLFKEFKDDTVDDCAAQAMQVGDFIELISGSSELAYLFTDMYYDWCINKKQ